MLFTACEKAEQPFTLPPKGSAQIAKVDMGEYYDDQVFFDFESGTAVKKTRVDSWDLAFESDPSGFHIFLNGGKNIFVYNTGSEEVASFTTPSSIKETDWLFDAPNGLPDSTGIGDWRNKKYVYILKFQNNIYKKIVIESVSNTEYILRYGDVESSLLSTIIIPKDPSYNYAYFSFEDGGKVVSPDPPKDTWDIVFTKYRYIYYDLDNFPYLVSGVLLNPYNTTALPDSSDAFASITYNSNLVANTFSNHRDVIGFDWKRYNFNTGLYEVNSHKSYIIKNRREQYWKIHFLDFYSSTGMKGSPGFEYERIH